MNNMNICLAVQRFMMWCVGSTELQTVAPPRGKCWKHCFECVTSAAVVVWQKQIF